MADDAQIHLMVDSEQHEFRAVYILINNAACYRLTYRADLHFLCFFFFNDTAPTKIYTLSLHDALPIQQPADARPGGGQRAGGRPARGRRPHRPLDRKRTRLTSSKLGKSYAGL